MVKNTKGGKSHKSVARKFFQNKSSIVRTPSNELESFGVVFRHNGFTCTVYNVFLDNIITCHIRGKFRGRSKLNNLVSPGKIVLIGLRDFEAPNYTSCDLLEVYEHDEVNQLINTEYGSDIHRLLSNYNNTNNFSSAHSNTFDFDTGVSSETTENNESSTQLQYDYSEIDISDI
jgi:hypothetical protein